MTSSLRRKRRITVRGLNTPKRMAASLLGLALSLGGGHVHAEPGTTAPTTQVAAAQPFASPSDTLSFSKEPSSSFGSDNLHFSKDAGVPATPLNNVLRFFKDSKPAPAPASSFGSDPMIMSKDADRPSSFGSDMIHLTKEPVVLLARPMPPRVTAAPAGRTPYNAPVLNSNEI